MPRQSQVRAARELQPSLDAKAIRLRAARATFASTVSARMLGCVAAGMSPPWWKGADQSSKERWNLFDRLNCLLSQSCDDSPGISADRRAAELRELLGMNVPADVVSAGRMLADTLEACG